MEQKSHIRPIVIVMIFAFLTIGYAYLTSSLNINGSTLLKKPTWDVHFENIQVSDGSVTGEQVIDEPEIDTNKTTVTFHVNLKKPGDYYEFTVDAVNAGTIDAMIDNYSDLELTAAQQKYLETSITYEDGEEVLEHQQLLAGDTAVYKVRVGYKLDLEAEDLPSDPEQLDLEFSVEFVQRDESAIARRAEIYSLYNVLKNEAESGSGYAIKYTGAHQDSMNISLSTKDIYHWYSNSDSISNSIRNKNNVIFANHCWQMIRTTDTGGVKLIYNGEVDNNQCLDSRDNHIGYSGTSVESLSDTYYYGSEYSYDSNTNLFSLSGNVSLGGDKVGTYTCKATSSSSTCTTLYYVMDYVTGTNGNISYRNVKIVNTANYSQIGTAPFNVTKATGYVGYMYDKLYSMSSYSISYHQIYTSNVTISSSIYYADEIQYDSTSSKYVLVNPHQVSELGSMSEMPGKYIVLGGGTEGTAAMYVLSISDTRIYYKRLEGGNVVTSLVIGDSFTNNGDGTFTIVDPITVTYSEWYRGEYRNWYGTHYICDGTSATCEDLRATNEVDSYDNTGYYYYGTKSKGHMFAESVSYENGVYTLTGDVQFLFSWIDSSTIETIKTHHYYCDNWNTSCTKIHYVFEAQESIMYDLIFDGYNNISEVLESTLNSNTVNSKNSLIKAVVDSWYEKHMLPYGNYLEDTVFCNDREIVDLGPWNPNGGNIVINNNYLKFSNSQTKKVFTCSQETDRFSINNPKARLTYKVGLITLPELQAMNRYTIFKTGNAYWTMSPHRSSISASGYIVTASSSTSYMGTYTDGSNGVRPVISLKPGTEYTSGDGSMANPYVIDTN